MFVVYECVLIKWHAASNGFFLWLKTFFINVECSIQLQALQRGCIRGVNRNRNRELKTQTKVHFAFLPVVVVVSSWFLCVFFLNTFCFFCFALCCFKWILYICCCNYINSICSVVFSLYKREVCFGMEFWLWFVAVGT